ncbi:ROK family transcriptional regulator [Neomoorella humiferrea]|uniref:N-acetylglucosamine repressor n=1 Tax=Neomoorella humiferrea TaxID=676965 RepID=A0A2T0AT45_9FIRM|nr:ROK family transcriptional regulator [Moorella humiferrea]PRR73593.1 N-acetylglucosamine repressor [Moorella humiferrea]
MNRETGNLEYVKRLNRVNVLNIIRENKSVSRQQLAKLTGLTPAAISGIVRELVAMGFIQETGLGKSSGGRRPVKLQFNPEAGYVVGAEITRKKTTMGIVDLQAKPVVVNEAQIDMTEPETGLATLAKEIEQLIRTTGIPEGKILAAGFAVPGLLDTRTKIVKRSPNLGEQWHNIPVQATLEKYFHVPLFVEHNSNAAALAEHTLGRGKNNHNLLYINLGEGFSAGIIMNGEIIYGYSGHAGEMGHLVIMEDGPLCNCGNRGCLESLYAVPAIVRKANNELYLCPDKDPLKQIWLEKGEVNIKDIMACVREAGSYAWQLIRQAGWYIGIGIACAINFYNPEAIYLGGILAGAKEVLMESLLESVYRHAFPAIARATRIEISDLGSDAAFYGACLGAIKQLFDVERAEILNR